MVIFFGMILNKFTTYSPYEKENNGLILRSMESNSKEGTSHSKNPYGSIITDIPLLVIAI